MSTIRDKIIRLFQRGMPADAGVRELLARMPGELRASVSKECRYMQTMGLLSATRATNWHHGKRFLFKPTPLLLESGTMDLSTATLLRVLVAPMTNKDLRYALSAACGCPVARPDVQGLLDDLERVHEVQYAPGGSAKYPRYVRSCGNAPCAALAAVVAKWARMPGAWAGGVRTSNELSGRPARPLQ